MCVVNPREADAADEVRRCYEVLGIGALKLHPWLQGFSCSDQYMDPVYEVCAELGIPITFHDGSEWPNVYLTMSGPSMLAMQSIVDTVPAERIMYGSDFGWGPGGTVLIRYRLHKVQALKMDDTTRQLVLGGNALRLFGTRPQADFSSS